MSSSAAFEAQRRITEKMQEMVDDLDRTRLRKIQLNQHKCAARCCEDQSASLEQTQQCIEMCSRDVTQAQNYVQSEIGNFQNRMQRGVLDCQDSAKDIIGGSTNPSEDQVKEATSVFEKCAIGVVENHIKLLPDLLNRMKKHLESIKH